MSEQEFVEADPAGSSNADGTRFAHVYQTSVRKILAPARRAC
jgi:hypothetical protein